MRFRRARARGRWRAWELGAAPEQIVLDLDATLVTSHSAKQGAAGNYKGGYEDQSVIAIEQPALIASLRRVAMSADRVSGGEARRAC